MRSFCIIFLIVASLIVPSSSLLAQGTPELSVSQLKDELRKLNAIDRDANTPPNVRQVNRIFLKKRQGELQALLQKNVESLKRYLSAVQSDLRSEERLIVENTIVQAEKDLAELTQEMHARATELPDPTSLATDSVTVTAGTTEIGGGDGNGNANGNGASHNGNGASSLAMSEPRTTSTAVASSVANTPQATDVISLNADLNAKIRAKVRVDQTDNTKQTETPSISGASTSLVDQSSSSDLIGLAANFAGLSATSNSEQPEPSSVSVTTSAYSLLAAINRVDPLNPVFYDQHRNWRKFSLTLGYDDEDQPDGTKQRAKLFGAKFMFINRRDPGLESNQKYIETVTASLRRASAAFGNLSIRVRGFVFSLEKVRREIITPGFKDYLEKRKPQVELTLERQRQALAAARTASPRDSNKEREIQEKIADAEQALIRINKMLENPGDPELFVLGSNSLPTSTWSFEERRYQEQFLNEFLVGNYREKLGKEVADAIDEFIDRQLTAAELTAFRNLDADVRNAVERIRRAPQFSLAFLSKQRRIGFDEYLGELIFDYGVANRVNLSLNGSYRYNDSKLIGGDVRGFSFAGQLRFQLNRENLIGKKPFFFDVATQGNWMTGGKSIYKTQAKITLPIADGIEFPVSVTYANRTELIDEKEVRGQFGFTLDTARLIRAFLFR